MRARGNAVRDLLSPATALALVHASTSLPAGIVWGVILITLLAVSIALLPLAGIGFLLLYGVLQLASFAARTERARAGVLLGTGAGRAAYTGTGLLGTLRDGRRWREVGYLVLLLPVGVLTHVLSAGTIGAGVAFVAAPLYVGALPSEQLHLGPADVDSGGELTVTVLLGLVLIAVAPLLIRGVTALHGQLVMSLLGEGDRAHLVHRVEQLTETRARVVDASDAERRRIERDLHDGAQQRLVALAVDLGMAKARLPADSAAHDVVSTAHAEVKTALAELRDLVRGIHPAVLEDRGLDAALSALAARCSVPVTVQCLIPHRCPRQIEAIAYFVTAECLTNVTRHSAATAASVRAFHTDSALCLSIVDDGRGGAEPAKGSGLVGLRDRVAAVDGQLTVVSPPGGPTSIQVELPCES